MAKLIHTVTRGSLAATFPHSCESWEKAYAVTPTAQTSPALSPQASSSHKPPRVHGVLLRCPCTLPASMPLPSSRHTSWPLRPKPDSHTQQGLENKVCPALVPQSCSCLWERPDFLVGILIFQWSAQLESN